MSVALSDPPKAGDKVMAHVRHDDGTRVRQWHESITLPDGSMVITPENLALFGGGDARRGREEIRLMIAAERNRTVDESKVERPVSVRIATPNDDQGILHLLILDVAENASHIAPPDEDRIMEHIQKGTQRKGNIAAVIDGADGKPVAVCIMVPVQWWWSQSWAVQELVLFVHPEHRNSEHVKDLLKFQRWVVKEWTKSFGYQIYLLCGVLGIHRVRAKIMLYRRIFRQAGAVFVWPSPFKGDVT